MSYKKTPWHALKGVISVPVEKDGMYYGTALEQAQDFLDQCTPEELVAVGRRYRFNMADMLKIEKKPREAWTVAEALYWLLNREKLKWSMVFQRINNKKDIEMTELSDSVKQFAIDNGVSIKVIGRDGSVQEYDPKLEKTPNEKLHPSGVTMDEWNESCRKWDERELGADERYTATSRAPKALMDALSGKTESNPRGTSELVTVRLPVRMVDDLKNYGKANQIGYQTLIRELLGAFLNIVDTSNSTAEADCSEKLLDILNAARQMATDYSALEDEDNSQVQEWHRAHLQTLGANIKPCADAGMVEYISPFQEHGNNLILASLQQTIEHAIEGMNEISAQLAAHAPSNLPLKKPSK